MITMHLFTLITFNETIDHEIDQLPLIYIDIFTISLNKVSFIWGRIVTLYTHSDSIDYCLSMKPLY